MSDLADHKDAASVSQASPQFWESAEVGERNRVYFTAQHDGRISGGANGFPTLDRDEVVSLAAWLLRVSGAEGEPLPPTRGYLEAAGEEGQR